MYFMIFCYILLYFVIFCYILSYFVIFCYIFPYFIIFYMIFNMIFYIIFLYNYSIKYTIILIKIEIIFIYFIGINNLYKKTYLKWKLIKINNYKI